MIVFVALAVQPGQNSDTSADLSSKMMHDSMHSIDPAYTSVGRWRCVGGGGCCHINTIGGPCDPRPQLCFYCQKRGS